ncbi:MAG: FKBP-type peptidyl-prolyl cis-trans isomerase [Candidatus Lokiarchaeota archaeon]|nr:FKBP-type peptidyl-prolyl cis-trans isomerase [Candidatus Lokiarchaeota archaeon]
MAPIKLGDTVTVHYRGTLDNGDKFADSEEQGPIEFVVGDHLVIFENAVIGKEIGEDFTIMISAEDAYGEYDEENQQEFEKAELDLDKYEVGMQLAFQQGCDEEDPEECDQIHEIVGEIVEVKKDSVIIDFNHPLAGQNLNFWIKIEDVK